LYWKRIQEVMSHTDIPEDQWSTEWTKVAGAGEPPGPQRGARWRALCALVVKEYRHKHDADTWANRHSGVDTQKDADCDRAEQDAAGNKKCPRCEVWHRAGGLRAHLSTCKGMPVKWPKKPQRTCQACGKVVSNMPTHRKHCKGAPPVAVPALAHPPHPPAPAAALVPDQAAAPVPVMRRPAAAPKPVLRRPAARAAPVPVMRRPAAVPPAAASARPAGTSSNSVAGKAERAARLAATALAREGIMLPVVYLPAVAWGPNRSQCPFCRKIMPTPRAVSDHVSVCTAAPYELWHAKVMQVRARGVTILAEQSWTAKCPHCDTTFPSLAAVSRHKIDCRRRRVASGLPVV
jgi:hypothetical protein